MTAAVPLLALGSILVPLLFPLLCILSRWHRAVRFGLPLLPLPALVLALWSGPDWSLELPYLLTGALWVLDEIRQVFLVLTATLWATAGIFAVGYLGQHNLRRFGVFWSLTLAGNLGLIVSGDIASFYSFFALMTFAGYGLVIHEGSEVARRAGRIYLSMAVLGEMALLGGLVMAAAAADGMLLSGLSSAIAGSPHGDLMIGLLIAGFGVKAGLPLLHFWLPLAHPVAPTPASAVLSGTMIKAGLLGWLLTLPFGEAGMPGWGTTMIILGATASLGAALIGVCQQQPKAVLAYSSISQMGLITLMVGAALAEPLLASPLFSIIALYALHHGLAKGSLFLSAGLPLPARGYRRWLVWILIALPGFSLAGLPFTSGAVSKLAMKGALSDDELTLAVTEYLPIAMTAGAIATLLLVLRYLWTLGQKGVSGEGNAWRTGGWLAATLTSLALFWWMPWNTEGVVKAPAWVPAAYQVWALVWPMLVAVALAWLALRSRMRAPALPPGDGVVLIEWLLQYLRHRCRHITMLRTGSGSSPGNRQPAAMAYTLGQQLLRREAWFRRGAGLMLVLLIVVLVFSF